MSIGLIVLFFLPRPSAAEVIQADTTWSGEVSVVGDILVPEGVTLTIAAGAVIRVTPAESTRTDPEFLSPLTEIMVRGTLVAEGKKGREIVFKPEGRGDAAWAGIIIDGGRANLRRVKISGAETGVHVFQGSLLLNNSLLTGNRYGITAQGKDASVSISSTNVKGNEYGVLQLNGAKIKSRRSSIKGNRKKDTYSASAKADGPSLRAYTASRKEAGRIYGDEVILGTAVWQDRIEIRGVIRVPENSRLIILPGTVVEFKKRDTNGDGIGENGLLIQGMIIAKGMREHPIIFRSAEKQGGMGDWDAINIMNSDRAQNLIEYCQIQDAYRGLHFHFSNVAVNGAVLTNNYRGVQFQESIVTIRGTQFYGNKSAFQARDSEIAFEGNLISRNYSGMNVFRNSITLADTVILNNALEGIRMREGLPLVERNLIDGNRHGLMVTDAVYGTYAANVFSHNLESGISLRNTTGIEIAGNAIQANGINGLNIQNAGAVIRGNLITDNGERGIGIQSFQGIITGNNITQNGLYNLGNDGEGDVSAKNNWWGGENTAATIFDKNDDPAKGNVQILPVMERPVLFSWPLSEVRRDSIWRGGIIAGGSITVEPGADLDIAPSTRVVFAKEAGLVVRGRIRARGETGAPITFTSRDAKGPNEWEEILIDHAPGSIFEHCSFEHATWALHSHFTDLRVNFCSFAGNYGGIRFTSGPITVTRSSFRENEIGIRAFRGTALITGNDIAHNRIGIFVREKGGGLTITKNNLFANSGYNIRLGDFNDEDVDAKMNWWGEADPESTIYDARSEPGVGVVRYEPYAKAPFPLTVPAKDGRIASEMKEVIGR